MNARFISTIRFGLAGTALTFCGALALTTGGGCAGGGSGGGSTNEGGSSGTAGSSGSGNTTGSSTSTPGGTGSCTPTSDNICFANGQASGGGQLASAVSGYGWVALGAQDTITSPVCATNPSAPSTTQPITEANACPTTGMAVWSANTGLCINGSIPEVTGADYTDNWGLQIGMNINKDAVSTLGVGSYTKVSFAFTDNVTPSGAQIRAEIHVKGDSNLEAPSTDQNYCLVIEPGTAVSLAAFNTECWEGGTPVLIGTAGTYTSLSDAVKNIDKIGIQISSDATSAYTVNNFCWTGITFQ
ncbi:MAG: hypothetical protein ABSB49_12890 [Polyangia bacterium]